MKRHSIRTLLAHGSIVMGTVFIVLFIIDRFNPYMDFLGSDQSDYLLLIFCIVSIANGIFTAVGIFRHDERRKAGEHEQR